ncbi:MAG: cation:proton antiporter [Polyangiaceae bacterium]
MLMTTLTALATGSGLSGYELAKTTGKLGLFLVVLVALGFLLVPRAVRAVQRLGRPETTLVASIGFCFAVSLLAHEFGYSVALGAFLAGSLIAESGEEKPIEHLVQPVRDMFGAIFFVSVGLLIDPQVMLKHWSAIVVLSLVVIVGKVLGVTLGAFLTGNGARTSIRSGMSLAQIGEFSFIIAGLGLSLKATGSFLYPVAVAVSAITTLTTPWLIKMSDPVSSFVDRKMPRPLQTFVGLYGSWIEGFRTRAPEVGRRATIRRLTRLLVLDVGLVLVIAIVASRAVSPLSEFVVEQLRLSPLLARWGVWTLAALLALPLLRGWARLSRNLGLAIALAALPSAPDGSTDLAAAPRRTLVAALQLGIVLVSGLLLLALSQPFLGSLFVPLLFLVLLFALLVPLWRGATNLHEHVQAGAQAIVQVLLEQARNGGAAANGATTNGAVTSGTPTGAEPHSLEQVQQLLPGIGEPTAFGIDSSSPAVGKSLAELNLRGVTGATVLAIQRGLEGLLVPSAAERLQAGDVLALAGTHEAVDAARELLRAETRALA